MYGNVIRDQYGDAKNGCKIILSKYELVKFHHDEWSTGHGFQGGLPLSWLLFRLKYYNYNCEGESKCIIRVKW